MFVDMQLEKDVQHVKEDLAQALFDHIPVGVGSQGIIPTTAKDLEAALEMGMDWSLREVGHTSLGTLILQIAGHTHTRSISFGYALQLLQGRPDSPDNSIKPCRPVLTDHL